MIPLRDVIPSRTTPIVTVAIILVNALAFAYELSLGPQADRLLAEYGLVPGRLAPSALVTSMFLHGGILQVAGNLLYLWIFGHTVEDRMGHARFLAFYLLCGVGAALTQTVATPGSLVPMVGASGAIAGVMGAYIVLYPRSKIVTLIPIPFFLRLAEVPAMVFVGLFVLVHVISGVRGAGAAAGGDPVWAHAAGFAMGAAGVFLFRRPERQRVEWWDPVPRG
jgi:membrane associated rhomboid family serine protease